MSLVGNKGAGRQFVPYTPQPAIVVEMFPEPVDNIHDSFDTSQGAYKLHRAYAAAPHRIIPPWIPMNPAKPCVWLLR